MPVYISLLRGINVGGSKIIRMDELKGLYAGLGFTDVATYIQSGNVVFGSGRESPREIEKRIKHGIKESFKLDVEILVLELGELEKLIEGNPFVKRAGNAGGRVYFTFLLQEPAGRNVNELEGMRVRLAKVSNSKDDFRILRKTIYVHCLDGWSKSPFNSSVTERLLKVDTTSRNLETMQKLAEIGNRLSTAGKQNAQSAAHNSRSK